MSVQKTVVNYSVFQVGEAGSMEAQSNEDFSLLWGGMSEIRAERPQDGPRKCLTGGQPDAWNNTRKSPWQSTGLCRISGNSYVALSGERVDSSPQMYRPFQPRVCWLSAWIDPSVLENSPSSLEISFAVLPSGSNQMSGLKGLLQGLETWSNLGPSCFLGQDLMTSCCHFCHTISSAPAWAFKCGLPLVTLCPLLALCLYSHLGFPPSTEPYSFWHYALLLPLSTYLDANYHLGISPPQPALVFLGLAGTQLWLFSATGLLANIRHNLFVFSEIWNRPTGQLSSH